MTKMAAMLINGKNPLEIFFSRTGRPISTKLGMVALGLQPIIVYSNDDPRVTLTYFTAWSNLVILAFLWGKSENSGFAETIATCDLKVGRCRQLIEIMKVCEYSRSRPFFLPYIFQVMYVLCFTRPRYQVSVYRTIGPLV